MRKKGRTEHAIAGHTDHTIADCREAIRLYPKFLGYFGIERKAGVARNGRSFGYVIVRVSEWCLAYEIGHLLAVDLAIIIL